MRPSATHAANSDICTRAIHCKSFGENGFHFTFIHGHQMGVIAFLVRCSNHKMVGEKCTGRSICRKTQSLPVRGHCVHEFGYTSANRGGKHLLGRLRFDGFLAGGVNAHWQGMNKMGVGYDVAEQGNAGANHDDDQCLPGFHASEADGFGGLATWREILIGRTHAETQRREGCFGRFHSGRPLTTRTMPSFIRVAPKLRTKPSFSPVSFR
jgi:hypothetical protein